MNQGEVIAKLETLVDRLDKVLTDHEARIRTLEQGKWRLAGGLGLACFLIPIILSFLI